MNKSIALVIGIGLLIAGGGALWYFNPFGRNGATLRLPGTVEVQEVRLGSKLGGRVKSVSVREGQRLKAREELARFETPELDAQHAQLQARLAAAKAELAKAESGPRQEEKDEAKAAVDAAEARLAKMQKGWREEEKRAAKNEADASEAELIQTKADFARLERLARETPGGVTRSELDAARAARDRAQNRWFVLQARYDMLMNGSRPEDVAEMVADVARAKARHALLMAGTRDEDKALARAQVAEIQGRLDENEAQLKEAIVRAPGPAVIEVLSIRAGDLLPPNATIARILNDEDLWVKVFVPETELGKIRQGQAVEVSVDAYPGRRFPGTIDQIANQSEFTPRNVQSPDERKHQVFAVKVRIDNREGMYKSGMAADVFLPLNGAPK